MRNRDAYRFDDDEVRDKESVRVPMFLIDTVRFENRRPLARLSDLDAADLSRHQPGYRVNDDDASRDAVRVARDGWIKQTTQAWRMDAQPKMPADDPDDDDDSEVDSRRGVDAAIADARAARAAWIRRISDAWKHPPAPDAREPAAAQQSIDRHLRGQPDDNGAPDPGDVRAVERRRLTRQGAEAQRERDLAWARYRDNLANAWKANPRAAVQIERQGERWRGGR